MKIKVNTQRLREAVKLTALVAGKRSTLPTTNHILLKAAADSLVILGTNIQSFIESSCPCEIDQPGAVCLPAEKLLDFLNRSSADETTLELEGKKVRAVTGGTVVHFAYIAAEEFPSMPKHKAEWSVNLPEKEVVRGLDTVKPAICDNIGRTSLCGVLIELRENKCNFTASNGSFLIHTNIDHIGEGSAIVPAEIVEFAIRACGGDSDDPAEIAFSKNGVLISTERCAIFGPLINETFPNWRDYLPKETKTTFSLPRQAVISSIQKVRPFTDERFHPVQLEFSGSELTISNIGGEHDVKDTVPLDCLVQTFKCQLNPDSLEKTLSVMVSEKVDMRVLDHMSPLVFEEQNFLGVIVPCVLNKA